MEGGGNREIFVKASGLPVTRRVSSNVQHGDYSEFSVVYSNFLKGRS